MLNVTSCSHYLSYLVSTVYDGTTLGVPRVFRMMHSTTVLQVPGYQ